MTSRLTLVLLFLLLTAAPGCGGTTTTDPDAATLDAASPVDAATTDANAPDAGSADDAATTSDSGTTDDAATTDAATTDAASCPPQPTDLTPRNTDCRATGICPAGFTCRNMAGIAPQATCQILCEPDGCPCPDGLVCNPHTDMTGSWNQCEPS